MRFSLRLMLPVIACLALISGLFAYYQVQDQEQALHKELDQRASLAAQSLADNLQPLLDKNASAMELRRALNRLSTRERILGAAIFDDAGKTVAMTDRLPASLENALPELTPKVDPESPEGRGAFLTLGTRYYHAETLSMRRADGKAMGLGVFHDAGFIREQSAVIWRQTLIHVSLEVLLIVLITFLVIRWSLVSPITKAATVAEGFTQRKVRRCCCAAAQRVAGSPGERDGRRGEVFAGSACCGGTRSAPAGDSRVGVDLRPLVRARTQAPAAKASRGGVESRALYPHAAER